jgi:hypothetical protein
VWRVSIIIFHPLIFAIALVGLWRASTPWSKSTLLPAIALILLTITLLAQSAFHFDPQIVLEKRKHGSAQRNWNLNYGQNYAFYDGSFRYSDEFLSMTNLVDKNSVILSDLATSYYASAYLPGSVVNVHRHQGRLQNQQWRKYLELDGLCGAVDKSSTETLLSIIVKRSKDQKILYLLNTDRQNRNVRVSCESNREHIIRPFLDQYAQPLFKGQYLELYDFSGLAP